MEYRAGIAGSFRLCAGELDNFRPLLPFSRDELAEIRRRTRKRHAAHIGKSRLDLRIGQAGIDLLVELVDDLGGGVLGRALGRPEYARSPPN